MPGSMLHKAALIIVDVQQDFCPGGALAVSEGDQVVPVLNRYIQKFVTTRRPVFATRDWHPQDHCSFTAQGGPWPPHCVQETPGAQFHSDLKLPPTVRIISKATQQDTDAYSGFQGTALGDLLKQESIQRVFVGGLATEYCVKHTVLDALNIGLATYVLCDAIRGVNAERHDSREALALLQARGARMITCEEMG